MNNNSLSRRVLHAYVWRRDKHRNPSHRKAAGRSVLVCRGNFGLGNDLAPAVGVAASIASTNAAATPLRMVRARGDARRPRASLIPSPWQVLTNCTVPSSLMSDVSSSSITTTAIVATVLPKCCESLSTWLAQTRGGRTEIRAILLRQSVKSSSRLNVRLNFTLGGYATRD